MSSLDKYREKWREAPSGSDMDGRVWSTDLMALPDDRLLAAWHELAAERYAGEIGWVGPLYADTFRGRQVIELGSGLGYDGLGFAERGASWTFADIVPENLALIRRVAGLKGLTDRVRFHQIADDLSFAGLPRGVDAIWVCGSIHHVPFEVARGEALALLPHLVPGGRWIELVYPRERWLREGAPPFEQWGKLTDGERTPWAEWHDVEKVKRRLMPAPFRTLLDFGFCGDNYRWIDLQYTADKPFDIADYDLAALSRSVDLLQESALIQEGARSAYWPRDWSFVCPSGLFAPAVRIDLDKPLRALGAAKAVAIDLELDVTNGAVGVGLINPNGRYLTAAEAVVTGDKVVTLLADEEPALLAFRNMHSGVRAAFTVRSAKLRAAA